MEGTQELSGNFETKNHQLNGNNFFGPVSFSTPHQGDNSNTLGVQDDPRRGSAKRSRDEVSEKTRSSLKEDLTWEDCIQSLVFEEWRDRERIIDKQIDGTCEWLLKSPIYLKWVQENGLLLIRGKPGCGKSTLMKFVLGEQAEAAASSGDIVISFFFYASGTGLQNGILGLFRSLLYQLFDKDDNSRPTFHEICRKHSTAEGKRYRPLTWYPPELEEIFEKLVFECSNRRTIKIFIDAIDECRDEDRDRLIRYFHRLNSRPWSGLKRPGIFFTCRHHPNGQIAPDFEIRHEEENENDIQKFIDQELRLPDETERVRDEFKQLLQKRADGLFLWLFLIIPRIHDIASKGFNTKIIQLEIMKCPQKLDGIYEDLLGKIEDKELLEAGKLFQWICFARRPLSLDELRTAMTIHLSGPKGSLHEYEDEYNPMYIPNDQKMKTRMIHLSRGLVDIASTKSAEGKSLVGFYHETIKEFMLTKGLRYLDQRLKEGQGLLKTANLQLAHTCLDYLSTKEIRNANLKERKSVRQQFVFLDYTVSNWLAHAKEAERAGLGEEINWPSQDTFDAWICASWFYQEGTRLIHIAAQEGLDILVKTILSGGRQKAIASNQRDLTDSKTGLEIMNRSSPKIKKKTRCVNPEQTVSSRQSATGRTQNRLQRGFAAKDSLGILSETNANLKEQSIIGPVQSLSIQKGKKLRITLSEEAPVGHDINAEDYAGNTPLHLAACGGHFQVVSILHEHGAAINATDRIGSTPLHEASELGHLEIVKFLYEHGANTDIDRATNDGWTPLNSTSYYGHLDVVRFLYENGANTDIHRATDSGLTPLYSASNQGHLEIVKFLYEHGANTDIDRATNDGWTPLNSASYYGHLDVVRFLYKHGADINTATNSGLTPLISASDGGHLDMVKFLYEYGANTDINRATNNGWTPLILASNLGHLSIVKFLYERGADIHKATNGGWTPLISASDKGHLSIVKFLYENGADIHKATNDGWTSLNLASEKGHLDVVKFVCEHGAEFEAASKSGVTPLHSASFNGHLDVVRFLCEYGADIHKAMNDGWTSLNLASEKGHLDVVKFVCKHGAEFKAASKSAFTPLHSASFNGHLDVVKFLCEYGADIHKATNDGWTSLNLASGKGHLDVVKLLCQYGAEVKAASRNGTTALHLAANYGHQIVAEFLLNAEADPEAIDNIGWTPCMSAIRGGNLSLVKAMFIHPRSEPFRADMEGRNLLHIAARFGHEDIFDYLIQQEFSPNETDLKGDTILHYAAAGSSEKILTYVIGHHDVVNKVNCSWSPLHWAFRAGDIEIIELLLSAGVSGGKVATREPKGFWGPAAIASYHNIYSKPTGVENGNKLVKSEYTQGGIEPTVSSTDSGYPTIQARKHRGFGCDRCFFDIYGPRFHCVSCFDFDYCFMCKLDTEYTHPNHEWEIYEPLEEREDEQL